MISPFDYVKGLLFEAANGTVLGFFRRKSCAGVLLFCMALTIAPTVISCKKDTEPEVVQSEVSKIFVSFWVELGIIPSTTKSASVYDANPKVANGDITEYSYYNTSTNRNEYYTLNSDLTTNNKAVYDGVIVNPETGFKSYTRTTYTEQGNGLNCQALGSLDFKPASETTNWKNIENSYREEKDGLLLIYNLSNNKNDLCEVYSPDTQTSIQVKNVYDGFTYKLDNLNVIQKE